MWVPFQLLLKSSSILMEEYKAVTKPFIKRFGSGRTPFFPASPLSIWPSGKAVRCLLWIKKLIIEPNFNNERSLRIHYI